jgi:hypothetical protein
MPPMPRTTDLTGTRWGRWTVLGLSSRDAKHCFWNCHCDCGTDRIVAMATLRNGKSQSCGCLRLEVSQELNVTHGHTRGRRIPPEYLIWCAMKSRCYNPKVKSFKHYGGRGIRVCSEWRDDFARFLSDMGPRPTGTTIERKNNDGPYSPGNCVWATRGEQAANKRGVRHVTFGGATMPLAAAIRASGLRPRTVYRRIWRGWPEGRWFEESSRDDNRQDV